MFFSKFIVLKKNFFTYILVTCILHSVSYFPFRHVIPAFSADNKTSYGINNAVACISSLILSSFDPTSINMKSIDQSVSIATHYPPPTRTHTYYCFLFPSLPCHTSTFSCRSLRVHIFLRFPFSFQLLQLPTFLHLLPILQ